MSNLIEEAKNQVSTVVDAALRRCVADGTFPEGTTLAGTVESVRDRSLGDYSTSCALAAAHALHMAPKAIAEKLIAHMDLEGSYFASAQAAGPGFINFCVSPAWYGALLRAVETEGADYGRVNDGKGEKVMVEFVSANPTGPMTIGNARGGVLGDSLASVLDMAGYQVWREFYVNDAGNQVDKFGRSIDERYCELLSGDGDVEKNLNTLRALREADSDWEGFPEDAYHGWDIVELAQELIREFGDKYLSVPASERQAAFIKYALPRNIRRMKEDLADYRIHFDQWFLESSLHESGYVKDTVDFLTESGLTYEKDGALWLKNTALGADKDEVLRRSNGFYTYYAVDIAYHRNKFIVRGFDRVIDVWGADHHGHAIRFQHTMSAPGLGLDKGRLDFLIMQMVRLVRDGEVVKVSKRTGKALTLHDLLEEISCDACRFSFNAKPDTHLEFDLGLAVRQDSENPVYYVQYAHARICSLIAALREAGYEVPEASAVNAALLTQESELELLRKLAELPEEVRLAARDYDPSRINRYVVELAAAFHRFYNSCRIKGEEEPLLLARLKLADTTRAVIRQALGIVGITAPEHM